MKRLIALLVLASAMVSAQTAETRVFRAILSPANEVPPITGLDASGTATLTVHVVRNAAGDIVSGSVDFYVNYSFPGATTFTGLHIHNGPAGVNAGVTVNSGISGASPVVDPAGRGTISRQGQVQPADRNGLDTLAGLFRDPSQYYVNLHTTVNPGGAIRGQLQNAQTAVLMGLMSPLNEVPPIQGLNASGIGTVVANVTRDGAGNITSGEVIFDVVYSFPSEVTFTGLHIHPAPAGVNGPVVLNSGMTRGPSAESGRGSVRFRAEFPPANAAAVAALDGLFLNPGVYYINIHTTDHTGGALRAQLRRTDLMTFGVSQLPGNEVPPVAGLDASAISQALVNTLRAEDGTVQAAHVRFDVNYRFPGETEFIGLHIHDGVAGENGPVRIDSGLSAANSVRTATGFGNIFEGVTVTDANGLATLNSLVANPDRHYLNLHTTVNRPGAVRAQLAGPRAGPPAVGGLFSAVNDAALTTAAPAGLISIFGANFAAVPTGLDGWEGSRVPTSLNGVEVTVGGRSAPVVYVSDTRVNAQVPVETASGPQPVVVRAGGASSVARNMTIAPAAPAVFFHAGGGIVVKNADFSLVTADNPAAAGDVLLIYLTGMGLTSPPLRTGEVAPASPLASTAAVEVTIGGQNAPVVYSLASPGFLGLYQVAVRMPAGVRGFVPVVVRMGAVTANTVSISAR